MNGHSTIKPVNNGSWGFSGLSILIGISALTPLAVLCSTQAAADEVDKVEFNESFLRSHVNVKSFENGNPVSAGIHRVDIYLNGQWQGRENVKFVIPTADSTIAQPCYTAQLLDLLGINLDAVDKNVQAKLAASEQCASLSELISGTTGSYDSATQQLNVTAPQLILKRQARGYVSPKLWDKGITAGTLQYDYNAYRTDQSGRSSQTSQYLSLRGGLNLDVWRLRYSSSLTWYTGEGSHYHGSEAYAERALVDWQSKLILGQSTTDGQVFDSLGYIGAQLASDDRMYPDSQRGFAPIIRGIANTTALVKVSQRGNQIYEITVPPGPFQIDDLYPSGSGGDLLVTIKEADGSEHSFTVTYASIAELLRPGETRYSLVGGEYHNTSISETPGMMVGTLRHGFSNIITGYMGSIGSQYYQSAAGGLAFNTSIGAIAADVTQAWSNLGHKETEQGQSVRFTYAKILPVINTNVTLASYRYSSSGYYSMDDAMALRETSQDNNDNNWYYNTINRRNRFQINATQALPDSLGNVSINASMQDYWNRGGTDTEYQASYSNYYKRINYSFNFDRTRDLVSNSWDNKIMLTVSVPLGSSEQTPYLTNSYSYQKDHQGLQSSLSGSAGSNREYQYGVFASTDRYNDEYAHNTTTGGGNVSWSAPYATLGGSASTGSYYQQYGANISGGVIAYNDGIVLTPQLGDTSAIIVAENASGARVTNYNGLRLDRWGRAVVPYLTPYRQNTVEIDPKGLSHDVELKLTSQNVAPTAGAVTLLKYNTEQGYSVLVNVKNKQGLPLPFGSTVYDSKNNSVGYIAQAGQGLLRVKEQKGVLKVQWGDNNADKCTFDFNLPPFEPQSASDFRHLNAICQ